MEKLCTLKIIFLYSKIFYTRTQNLLEVYLKLSILVQKKCLILDSGNVASRNNMYTSKLKKFLFYFSYLGKIYTTLMKLEMFF